MSGADRLMRRGAAAVLAYLESDRREPCEHGHYGCAVGEGGACSDELHALAVVAGMIGGDE